MINNKSPRIVFTRLTLGLTIAVATLAPISHSQAFLTWNGTSGANPNDPTNTAAWANGTAPNYNTTNPESFWMATGSSNLNYTAAQGATTFGANTNSVHELSWLGWQNGSGAGGVAGVAVLSVTGGTINFNGGWQNDGGTESMWIGNSGGSTATVAINGGAVNLTNGTVIGRDGSAGILTIASGSFTTGRFNSSIGIYVGANINNSGTGKVTIADGGQFSLTGAATEPIQFGSLNASALNTSSNFLNFTTDSTGTISLNLTALNTGTYATPLVYLQNLVSNGYVQIDNVTTTTLNSFSFDTTTPGASTLLVASAVPEPHEYALAISALLTVVILARRRRASLVA